VEYGLAYLQQLQLQVAQLNCCTRQLLRKKRQKTTWMSALWWSASDSTETMHANT